MLDLSKRVIITQEALDKRLDVGNDTVLSNLIYEYEELGEYFVVVTDAQGQFDPHFEKIEIGDVVYFHSRFEAGLVLKRTPQDRDG